MRQRGYSQFSIHKILNEGEGEFFFLNKIVEILLKELEKHIKSITGY
jgi:hypothetical protein